MGYHHQGQNKGNRIPPVNDRERLMFAEREVARLKLLAMERPNEPVYSLAVKRAQGEADAIRRVIAAQRKRSR